MTLTKFRKEIFQAIKSNRNPESYVAGSTMIQREQHSSWNSHDIDLFHGSEMAVASAGCLYLDERGQPIKTIVPSDLKTYHKHFGTLKRSWPRALRN